jgi:hypothetical protein
LFFNFSRPTTIQQEALEIAQFAERNINFDEEEIKNLYTAAESGDRQTIIDAVTEARRRAAEMLGDRHPDFCTYVQTILNDRC